jgi:hypothetical protein
MTYVRDVHLKKTKPIHKSYKEYGRKGSVTKNFGPESRGTWRQEELIGSKPPVVK